MKPTVVNIVAAGRLDGEFDLSAVAADIDAAKARYDPNRYPGIHIQLQESGPTITLYRNGKYHITGSKTFDQLNEVKHEFITVLNELVRSYYSDDGSFEVNNIVCTAVYPGRLDLNEVSLHLGLEHTEYEPEQFPAVIYRSADLPAVVLIFSSGKIVITGSKHLEEAETACNQIQSKLQQAATS